MRRPSVDTVRMLEERAYQIRRLALEMITYGQVGHPGGSLSEAEVLACLYFSELRVDPKNPKWPERDRFILSKAHACPGQYAALALRGFFPIEEIYTYGAINSRLQSHPDMKKTPGIEISGGSLGQGLSVAVGMAMGLQHFGRYKPVVYCMIGDGEVNEGQIWEAAMAASHYHLDNLIGIIDYNKVQAKGFTHELMNIEPLADKWRAFGWEVQEIDGHDIVEILEILTSFYRHETCGQCAPCRAGTASIVAISKRILIGEGRESDIDLILSVAETMEVASLCPLGKSVILPVRSALDRFRDEFLSCLKDPHSVVYD